MENLTINQSLFENACRNTSFYPEERAKRLLLDYESQVNIIEKTLVKAGIQQEERHSILLKYKAKYEKWLSAKSRCISSMITGPANFPARKAERANNAESARFAELLDFRNIIIPKICRRANPDTTIIKTGESETGKKLEKELSILRESLSKIKEQNKHSRHKISIQPTAKIIKKLEIRLKEHNFLFSLKNEEVKTDKISMKINKEIGRVQLFFEKGNLEIRKEVKKNGFRWSPKNQAWQRQLTMNAIFTVSRILNLYSDKKVVVE